MAFLHALKPLAGEAILRIDAGQQLLIGFKFVLQHLLLEGGRDRNELEGGMRDDDRIPVRGRGARQEAITLLLHEIGLVGDEDAGVRVERQKLTRGLRQAMARHHKHGLVDQAEPALAAIESVLPAPTAWAT
jgi:hypothetical protein